MTWHTPARQRGSALVVALGMVAIAAVLAASALEQQQLNARQAEVSLRLAQARQLVLGMEDWAIEILERDRRASAPEQVDGLQDPWTQALPPTPIPGGLIAAALQEQSGRFNLNQLLDATGQPNPVGQRRLRCLLEQQGLDVSLADRLTDAIDADQQALAGGAEDAAYGAPVALGALGGMRLPANRPLRHLSELRWLPGLDQAGWQRLAGLVQVAPIGSPLNINTAPLPVLACLDPAIDAERARSIERQRGAGYENLAAFLQSPALSGVQLDPAGLATWSELFLLNTELDLGQLQLRYESLLQRRGNQYHVLYRRQLAL